MARAAAMIAAPARNDPCPCGSGKRYKTCHGAAGRDGGAGTAKPAGENAKPAAELRRLANELFALGDYAASAQVYDRFFELRRDPPAALWVRRGIAQQRSQQLAAAEKSFREAAIRAPDDAHIHTNIGTMCVEQGLYAEAEAPLARALELEPGNAYALAMLAHARQHRCDWDGIDELFTTLQRLLEERATDSQWPVTPFHLLAMPLPPQTQLQAAKNWARALAPPQPVTTQVLRLAPGERLRIGFVSSDLREHPVAILMTEFWERLDRSRIEAFAYGLLPEDRGPIGQRIKRAFEHYVDVSRNTDADIARRIRDDRIAILFDLNGYTTHARSEVFALSPAPVQVNYLGYPDTLGAAWYDQIVVDHFLVPPEARSHYVEHCWYLPHAHFPSDTTRAPQGPPPSRAECSLPEQGFVFCCFNNAYKILPDVFALWLRLLSAVPGCVLWLRETSAEATVNLRREAGRADIAPERLIFAPWRSGERHVARCGVADLFLDTFPYGAGATANDALLAGLPIVTCAGETLVSRICGSQLHAIGLPELVTSSLAEYEALALRLAQHPSELAALRARLAANRWTEPLFDMPRYARDFEDGLFRVWREHVSTATA